MSKAQRHAPDDQPSQQRLDQWLWFSRFLKTRPLAVALIEKGRVRVNGQKTNSAHRALRIGDRITLALPHFTGVIEVTGFPTRRGTAEEAQSQYHVIEVAHKQQETQ